MLPRSEQIAGRDFRKSGQEIQATVFDVKKIGSRAKVFLSRTRKPSSPVNGNDGIAAQKFHEQFPADFISEALDQTRGWFYSQLAHQHAAIFAPSPGVCNPWALRREYPHPFRNCIVLGLMLGEDGQKMVEEQAELPRAGRNF